MSGEFSQDGDLLKSRKRRKIVSKLVINSPFRTIVLTRGQMIIIKDQKAELLDIRSLLLKE
jgi:hypothetical protein